MLTQMLRANVGAGCLLLVGFIAINGFVVAFYNPQPETLPVKFALSIMYFLSIVALVTIGKHLDN